MNTNNKMKFSILKKFSLICLYIFISSDFLFAKEKIDFTDFDAYQFSFTKEEISYKIKTYLEKDSQICNFYKLTEKALYIGDLASHKIDYILYFNNNDEQKERNVKINYKNLKGAKIAIDPGHFGGDYAKLEQRYVKIPKKETKTGTPIIFDEGTLTYLTALELKNLLEAKGAIVFLTREKIGKGAIKKDFFEWLRENPNLWASTKVLPKLFREYYNREDLICRAEKINEFNPDITVIIHYNAHLTKEEKQRKVFVTKTNYNLAFIPAAFCSGELNNPKDRYEFLRLLLTDNIEKSLKLSQCLVNQFVKKLKVPLINDDEKVSYKKACLKQEEGIYSRNLALTRLIHSPLCYGETLIQNNEYEIYKLTENNDKIGNISCSSRIKEVANAYFIGIEQYFKLR